MKILKSPLITYGKLLILTLVLTLSALTVFPIKIVSADPAPKMHVEPPTVITEPGQNFTIQVNITGVTDLYAWEFKLDWDVNVLSAISVTEGPFLKQGGMTVFNKAINNLQGDMQAGSTLIGSFPGVDGNGTLAIATFNVTAPGETSLDLYDTKMWDSWLGLITQDPPEDGFVQSAGVLAMFSWSPEPPKPVIVNETITFNATESQSITGSIVDYIWDFGDGNTTTVSGPFIVHVFNSTGSYEVTLNVTDDLGDSAKISVLDTAILGSRLSVHIVDAVIADVEPETDFVLPGSEVNINVSIQNLGTLNVFHQLGTGTINITAYYFNSTFTGVIGNVTVEQVDLYSPPDFYYESRVLTWNTTGVSLGTYTIKANITDPLFGEKNTTNNEFVDGTVKISLFEILSHTVTVGEVDFTVVTNSSSKVSDFGFRQADKEISFNVTGQEGVDGYTNTTIPMKLLNGDFTVLVDGASAAFTSLTQNITHSFIYVNYTHSTHKIQIGGTTAATPPIANCTVSDKNPYKNETVMFNASDSYDPDGSIANYTWDFGDGNTTSVTSPIIYHTYHSAGYQTVHLTVTDNDGLNTTINSFVHLGWRVKVEAVRDVAIKEITVSSTEITAGEIVSINVTAKNEGDTIETFAVTVYYDNATIKMYTIRMLNPGATNITVFDWNTTGLAGGTYTLKAEATLTGEPSDFLDNNIKIGDTILLQEKPVADFSYSPTNPTVEQTVTFDASDSYDPDGSIANYTWDFGDGNTTVVTTTTIVHTYSTAGAYNISLTVTDNDGQSAQKIVQATIGKRDSTITLSPSPATITLGENVTLSGQISPALSGATVTITYRLEQGQWNTLTTLVTSADGEYSYSWRPENAGTYEVKASWEGDVNINSDESDPQTVTVNQPADNMLIYIGAGVAIAAVAAVLLYLFVLRKPKQAQTG